VGRATAGVPSGRQLCPRRCWPRGGGQGSTPRGPCRRQPLCPPGPSCPSQHGSGNQPCRARASHLSAARLGKNAWPILFFAPPVRVSPLTVPLPGPVGALVTAGVSRGSLLRRALVSVPGLPPRRRTVCAAFSTAATRAGAQGPARTKCSVSSAIAEKQEFHFEKLKKKKSALFLNKPAVCSSPRGKAETRISATEMPDSESEVPSLALP